MRRRWFCYLCGAMTQREPDQHGRAYCRGHANLAVTVDFVPPDPFESLATAYGDDPFGTFVEGVRKAALRREDTTPRKGKAI